MQKITGLAAVILFLVLMICPITAVSDGFTMQIDGGSTYTWGDTIRFSGVANSSKPVYLFLEDPNQMVPDWKMPRACTGLTFIYESPEISIRPDGSWTYAWNSGDVVCKYPSVDADIIAFGSNQDFRVRVPIKMKAIITPTPTPTPNYDAKIAALETKIAAQETKINTQSTRIQEIADKTPIPTAIQTTIITPKPTATVDHAATIAALEKHLAEVEAAQKEQGDWIHQIMKFLGIG